MLYLAKNKLIANIVKYMNGILCFPPTLDYLNYFYLLYRISCVENESTVIKCFECSGYIIWLSVNLNYCKDPFNPIYIMLLFL